MEIPENTSEYLSADYWNERFKVEPKYEWLGEYSDNDMREKIHKHLERDGGGSAASDVVLVIGNGNSQMGQRVALDDKVTFSPSGCCITDISPVVVAKSRENAKGGSQKQLRTTSWAVCDMLHLPYKDDSVDLIIEKGAMDVLETDSGKDPWNPNPATLERLHRWLAEAHRVLAPQGRLISLSFAQPHFRRLLFDAKGYTWIVEESAYTTESESTESAESGREAKAEEGKAKEKVRGIWEYFIYFAKKGSRSGLEPYDRKSAEQQGNNSSAPLSEAEKRGCKEAFTKEDLEDREDFLFQIGGQDDSE
jgi:ubiquinone/menaquinone biosynthesis C-methylase UbiE